MIAIDSNILVYSVREESSWHVAALACVRSAAEGSSAWAIAWPSIHEFLAVVTHPKIYRPPTRLADAILQVEHWMESPTLNLIGETSGYWDHLKDILTAGKVAGPVVHDGRIAAICRANGVREIWTADRDYARFPGLRIKNPLLTAKGK